MEMCFGRGFVLSSVISAFLAVGVSTANAADFTTATYRLAVAEAAQEDKDIASFYRDYSYQPLWTGRNREDRERRTAFLNFLETSDFHGLPRSKYGIESLEAQLKSARTQADLADIEVEFSKAFLTFARDIQTGVLIPKEVDEDIARKVPYRKRVSYLTSLAESTPSAYFRALAPTSTEYVRLASEKYRLREILNGGDWGPDVPSGDLMGQGARDERVPYIRNRLIVMGYLDRSFGNHFDTGVETAIVEFQEDHGLKADGIVGPSTVEMLNLSAEDRLKSVMVAMERERWTNMERGERHVLVNLTDFTAKIYDAGEITFQTRSVVGHPDEERRSPEFSDKIEHMVVNPTWNVPRSIATKEYLPLLKEDRFALDYLNLLDPEGIIIDRQAVDFTEFTEEDFPFDMKQPPSNSNALGLVKFMFPNRYNIYLHDTPAKSLFVQERRAFSHGCIRLQDPFEFAYALLAVQSEDPQLEFLETLATGAESILALQSHVPVHIIYRTAVGSADGRMQYRRDVYGRDAKIWDALEQAGVALMGQES